MMWLRFEQKEADKFSQAGVLKEPSRALWNFSLLFDVVSYFWK